MKANVLEPHVNAVKKYLESGNVNVPFFIAGGSVFSLLNGNNRYDDIDVFFYNTTDCEKVQNAFKTSSTHVSTNAMTFERLELEFFDEQKILWKHDIKLQFVTKCCGTPEEIFSTFDFNCCRCAFTSDYKFVIDETYNTEIDYNDSNIGIYSINRYFKYVDDKGATDKNKKTFMKLLRVFIGDLKRTYPTYYNDKKMTAFDIINTTIKRLCCTKQLTRVQIIHDLITELYDTTTQIDIFKELRGFKHVMVPNPSDEILIGTIFGSGDNKISDLNLIMIPPERLEKLENKYPEYFI